MITRIEEKDQKEQVCRRGLAALPDWFGSPESVEEYARTCRELPLWAELEGEEVRGFIAMRPTSLYAAELYVMGVRQECHRQGIGRRLFRALYEEAARQGFRYLTVKTVEMGRYEDYDQTNRFYQALGFVELECLPTLWDAANPCQNYIMDVK
ncbi:MAG: GNAT family N-acetyltransferase [Acutalibacter sp.]|nr:GNAT family N-acetyltransferase [Acutalibacter sp.]